MPNEDITTVVIDEINETDPAEVVVEEIARPGDAPGGPDNNGANDGVVKTTIPDGIFGVDSYEYVGVDKSGKRIAKPVPSPDKADDDAYVQTKIKLGAGDVLLEGEEFLSREAFRQFAGKHLPHVANSAVVLLTSDPEIIKNKHEILRRYHGSKNTYGLMGILPLYRADDAGNRRVFRRSDNTNAVILEIPYISMCWKTCIDMPDGTEDAEKRPPFKDREKVCRELRGRCKSLDFLRDVMFAKELDAYPELRAYFDDPMLLDWAQFSFEPNSYSRIGVRVLDLHRTELEFSMLGVVTKIKLKANDVFYLQKLDDNDGLEGMDKILASSEPYADIVLGKDREKDVKCKPFPQPPTASSRLKFVKSEFNPVSKAIDDRTNDDFGKTRIVRFNGTLTGGAMNLLGGVYAEFHASENLECRFYLTDWLLDYFANSVVYNVFEAYFPKPKKKKAVKKPKASDKQLVVDFGGADAKSLDDCTYCKLRAHVYHMDFAKEFTRRISKIIDAHKEGALSSDGITGPRTLDYIFPIGYHKNYADSLADQIVCMVTDNNAQTLDWDNPVLKPVTEMLNFLFKDKTASDDNADLVDPCICEAFAGDAGIDKHTAEAFLSSYMLSLKSYSVDIKNIEVSREEGLMLLGFIPVSHTLSNGSTILLPAWYNPVVGMLVFSPKVFLGMLRCMEPDKVGGINHTMLQAGNSLENGLNIFNHETKYALFNPEEYADARRLERAVEERDANAVNRNENNETAPLETDIDKFDLSTSLDVCKFVPLLKPFAELVNDKHTQAKLNGIIKSPGFRCFAFILRNIMLGVKRMDEDLLSFLNMKTQLVKFGKELCNQDCAGKKPDKNADKVKADFTLASSPVGFLRGVIDDKQQPVKYRSYTGGTATVVTVDFDKYRFIRERNAEVWSREEKAGRISPKAKQWKAKILDSKQAYVSPEAEINAALFNSLAEEMSGGIDGAEVDRETVIVEDETSGVTITEQDFASAGRSGESGGGDYAVEDIAKSVNRLLIKASLEDMLDYRTFYLREYAGKLKTNALIRRRNLLLRDLAKLDRDIAVLNEKPGMFGKADKDDAVSSVQKHCESLVKSKLDAIKRDVLGLKQIKQVSAVVIDSKHNVLTLTLQPHTYVTDTRTGFVHDLGRLKISFPYSVNDPSVLRTSVPDKIMWYAASSSYSNPRVKSPYGPYAVVHGRHDGSACLGDAYGPLKTAMASGNVPMVAMLAIQYAESMNESDVWGRRCPQWRLKRTGIVEWVERFVTTPSFSRKSGKTDKSSLEMYLATYANAVTQTDNYPLRRDYPCMLDRIFQSCVVDDDDVDPVKLITESKLAKLLPAIRYTDLDIPRILSDNYDGGRSRFIPLTEVFKDYPGADDINLFLDGKPDTWGFTDAAALANAEFTMMLLRTLGLSDEFCVLIPRKSELSTARGISKTELFLRCLTGILLELPKQAEAKSETAPKPTNNNDDEVVVEEAGDDDDVDDGDGEDNADRDDDEEEGQNGNPDFNVRFVNGHEIKSPHMSDLDTFRRIEMPLFAEGSKSKRLNHSYLYQLSVGYHGTNGGNDLRRCIGVRAIPVDKLDSALDDTPEMLDDIRRTFFKR